MKSIFGNNGKASIKFLRPLLITLILATFIIIPILTSFTNFIPSNEGAKQCVDEIGATKHLLDVIWKPSSEDNPFKIQCDE